MEENLAYCGLICEKCPIYLATREANKGRQYKMRKDIAQEIKSIMAGKLNPKMSVTATDVRPKAEGFFAPTAKSEYAR